jgi:hypothetical protein
VDFGRPVEVNGALHSAEFTTVRVAPEYLSAGRVYFCEHKTPELIWRPEWMVHPNGASAVADFSIVVKDPAAQAAKFEALLGSVASSGDCGTQTMVVGDCRLHLLTQASYRQRHGALGCSRSLGVADDDAEYMGSVSIRTRSLDSVRRCLAITTAIEYEDHGNRITVAASSAYDCVIDFVQ